MPCKIQIKENVENFVDKYSQRGLSMSLQDANILASNLNAKMKHHVVSFYNDSGKVGRTINVPNELVDIYFDIEVKRRTPVTSNINTIVKDGVSELFDSNPDLANAVYEAAGLKTKTSENKILRNVKETLSFPGNYNNIDDGLIGRRVYEETIDGDIYKFEISNYSYEKEDGTYQSFYDIDFTVNGSEELVGSGFFNKSERGKQIIQALLSVNYGNDTVRFNVEESTKGKQKLALYKRLMSQLGYSVSNEMEYALFYNVKTDKVNLTPQQKEQAQQLYSQYLDTGKQDIEGFKKFVASRPAPFVNKFELDIKNLNLTPEVVNYLYQDSRAKSQGRDIENYKREISKIINNLQSDFTNSEILETIKCI